MTALTSRLRRRLVPVLVAGLLVTACATDDDATTDVTSSQGSEATTPEPVEDDTTEDGMSDDEMSDDEMSDDGMSDDAASDDPSAADTASPTTDATEPTGTAAPDVTATLADGSTITLGDYAGEPVFVETFATWCSNCRRQLGDTATAASTAGEATFLALSIETELDPSELDTYAQDNGFENVTFGVLDAASLATLSDTFGNAVLVPPSTPKFVVAPDGSVGDLTTGFESVDEILAQVGDEA